jgi:hypothetical protein
MAEAHGNVTKPMRVPYVRRTLIGFTGIAPCTTPVPYTGRLLFRR